MTALKYTLEKDGVSLQSLDKYVECITAMNDLIAEFGQFAAITGHSFSKISHSNCVAAALIKMNSMRHFQILASQLFTFLHL